MTEGTPNTPPRRLRRWFIAGFVIVFVGMLFFVNQNFYTGHAVFQCKLWRYYLLEIERASMSSGSLGPTSGSGTQALVFFVTHLVASGIGGLITMGLGAISQRSRK